MGRMMRPRWPRDLDARLTRGLAEGNSGLAEENTGRSVTPGPKVERARLPFLVGTDPGRFGTLLGQFALAIPAAAIAAFVVLWALTWMHDPSNRTADGDSGPTQAAVERGTLETAAAQTTGVAEPVGMNSTAPRETPKSQATSAPLRRLDREEIAHLLKRGEELVA